MKGNLAGYQEVPRPSNVPLFLSQSDARVGDDFMNQIQPVAAYVPYMTCPGNHEQA